MKILNKIKYLLLIFFMIIAIHSSAQDGPGDPGGNPDGGGNDPLGGDAPLSGGTVLLITIGAIYGGKKIFDLKKLEKEGLS